jgi:Ca2+-binding EF-hand superfamily protein
MACSGARAGAKLRIDPKARIVARWRQGTHMPDQAERESAELKRSFDECDPNNDGFIDVAEFHQLLVKLDGDVSRAECELDFALVDADEDGYISFKEFAIWWTG